MTKWPSAPFSPNSILPVATARGDASDAEKADAAPTEEGDADLGETEAPARHRALPTANPELPETARCRQRRRRRDVEAGEPIEVTMPEMGESVTEGTVLEWHVAVGDTVEEGQTLIEVSTDKVDAEVPAPVAGEITKLLVEPDQEIPIGAALVEMIPGSGNGASAPRRGSRREPKTPLRRRRTAPPTPVTGAPPRSPGASPKPKA